MGVAEHEELRRQLGALDEHVARAPARSQDPPDLRAEFATLLCFAKTLRIDAESWRAAFEAELRELERQERAARRERERLAVERATLMSRETRFSPRSMKRPDVCAGERRRLLLTLPASGSARRSPMLRSRLERDETVSSPARLARDT